MIDSPLLAVAVIVGAGIAAQWVAWRFRWPAIFLLLLFGFVCGPGLQWIAQAKLIDPDRLFGKLLLPAVSVGVAIILFEGGLSLRLRELKEMAVVRRLISAGLLATWLLAAAAACWILGFSARVGLVFGAILVVSGPTVIIPMLRHLPLRGQLGPILKWEGILNDPIGAVLAVLLFEALLMHDPATATVTAVAAEGLIRALLVAVITAGLACLVLIPLLRRYWIPDYLQSPVTLALVLLVFAVSNQYQPESGLLSVTLFGAVLANRRGLDLHTITQFKENLSVLVIAVLFITLAARVDVEDLARLGLPSFLFVAVLVLVIRPIAVWVSTVGTGLDWRQRSLLALMAPRGIVAAAVTSTFALEAGHAGGAQGGLAEMVPVMFLVIIGTITICGLLVPAASRWLGVADAAPHGYLILGAHPLARQIAAALKAADVRVVLIDSNWSRVRAARMDGLEAVQADIMSPTVLDEVELQGIGYFLAMTGSDQVNTLAALRLREAFERSHIYQLLPAEPEGAGSAAAEEHGPPALVGGRSLFAKGASYDSLFDRLYSEGAVKTTRLTEQFDFAAFQAHHGGQALPLLHVAASGDVRPFTTDEPTTPAAGQSIISLISGEDASGGETAADDAAST